MSRVNQLSRTVTEDIIAELHAGAVPWVQPWSSGKVAGLTPVNAATGRPYHGINIPLLWSAARRNSYDSHRWLTLKQANALGGRIRKGERGTEIVLVRTIPRASDDETDDEAAFVPLLRSYIVFNIAQVDGLVGADPDPPPVTDSELDAFVAKTGAEIRFGDFHPAYLPLPDRIQMPPAAAFDDLPSNYATLFHELGHWTGHADRLDRDVANRFGSLAYAAEELIAELTAAFLCAEFGVRGQLRHAGYIADWISLLESDHRALFTAASKAGQAAEYLKR